MHVLRKLGIEKLQEEQDKGIRAFVGGKNPFAGLPTGYGKSLCFALLPYIFDYIMMKTGSIVEVICVSPLTSLMMDQQQIEVIATEFVGEAQQDLIVSSWAKFSFCIYVAMALV